MKTNTLLRLFAVVLIPVTALAAASTISNWSDHCTSCHGVDGRGATKMGRKLQIRDFTVAATQAAFTDEAAFKAVREGLKDEKGRTRMKPIEGLSDDEIRDLVRHVRSLKQ